MVTTLSESIRRYFHGSSISSTLDANIRFQLDVVDEILHEEIEEEEEHFMQENPEEWLEDEEEFPEDVELSICPAPPALVKSLKTEVYQSEDDGRRHPLPSWYYELHAPTITIVSPESTNTPSPSQVSIDFQYSLDVRRSGSVVRPLNTESIVYRKDASVFCDARSAERAINEMFFSTPSQWFASSFWRVQMALDIAARIFVVVSNICNARQDVALISFVLFVTKVVHVIVLPGGRPDHVEVILNTTDNMAFQQSFEAAHLVGSVPPTPLELLDSLVTEECAAAEDGRRPPPSWHYELHTPTITIVSPVATSTPPPSKVSIDFQFSSEIWCNNTIVGPLYTESAVHMKDVSAFCDARSAVRAIDDMFLSAPSWWLPPPIWRVSTVRKIAKSIFAVVSDIHHEFSNIRQDVTLISFVLVVTKKSTMFPIVKINPFNDDSHWYYVLHEPIQVRGARNLSITTLPPFRVLTIRLLFATKTIFWTFMPGSTLPNVRIQRVPTETKESTININSFTNQFSIDQAIDSMFMNTATGRTFSRERRSWMVMTLSKSIQHYFRSSNSTLDANIIFKLKVVDEIHRSSLFEDGEHLMQDLQEEFSEDVELSICPAPPALVESLKTEVYQSEDADQAIYSMFMNTMTGRSLSPERRLWMVTTLSESIRRYFHCSMISSTSTLDANIVFQLDFDEMDGSFLREEAEEEEEEEDHFRRHLQEESFEDHEEEFFKYVELSICPVAPLALVENLKTEVYQSEDGEDGRRPPPSWHYELHTPTITIVSPVATSPPSPSKVFVDFQFSSEIWCNNTIVGPLYTESAVHMKDVSAFCDARSAVRAIDDMFLSAPSWWLPPPIWRVPTVCKIAKSIFAVIQVRGSRNLSITTLPLSPTLTMRLFFATRTIFWTSPAGSTSTNVQMHRVPTETKEFTININSFTNGFSADQAIYSMFMNTTTGRAFSWERRLGTVMTLSESIRHYLHSSNSNLDANIIFELDVVDEIHRSSLYEDGEHLRQDLQEDSFEDHEEEFSEDTTMFPVVGINPFNDDSHWYYALHEPMQVSGARSLSITSLPPTPSFTIRLLFATQIINWTMPGSTLPTESKVFTMDIKSFTNRFSADQAIYSMFMNTMTGRSLSPERRLWMVTTLSESIRRYFHCSMISSTSTLDANIVFQLDVDEMDGSFLHEEVEEEEEEEVHFRRHLQEESFEDHEEEFFKYVELSICPVAPPALVENLKKEVYQSEDGEGDA
ncbi:hypothetical protein J5N97_018759 [Dioscorea zingiberensis]|uniref:Uncharacterized protein n=1 Tax=Dioscorea zingiberensis TaxID=325984 RepID=A0A9D5HC15_9LILI|nr:hypothetical protein J5N97_018759 [Dioscorea zingiberensis]